MEHIKFEVNRDKFANILLNVKEILDESATGNEKIKVGIAPMKIVLNGDKKEAGVISPEQESRFVRKIVKSRDFNARFRMGFVIKDEIEEDDSIIGERKKVVRSYITLDVKAESKNRGKVKGRVAIEIKTSDNLSYNKAVYYEEILSTIKSRIKNVINRISRKDALVEGTTELYQEHLSKNISKVVWDYKDIDRDDIRTLVPLLFMGYGISPPIEKVLRRSSEDSLEDYYKEAAKLYDKGLVDRKVVGGGTVETWGFSPEKDLKISKRGVKILNDLVDDKELLKKLLKNRGYDEEEYL